MKRLLVLFLSVFFLNTLNAQMNINGQTLYGNEWINYNQDHYKMYIEEDGVYRIPYQTLADAGVPVNSIVSGNLQLYAMGKQIPLYITTNGTLTNADYIEFYAQKNKGEVDVHLHESPDHIFNPYYSMYTDTLAYFLTWNTAGNNSRLMDTPNNLAGLPAPEPFFMYESYNIQDAKYNKGKPYSGIYQSTFSPGEGYGSSFRTLGAYDVATENVYTAGGDAEVRIRFAASGSVSHNIGFSINGTGYPVDTAVFLDYTLRQIQQTLPASDLTATTAVVLEGLYGGADQYSTSFVKVKYPREFKFGNQNTFRFKLEADPANAKHLQITDFDHGGVAPVLYDLTNGLRIVTNLTNDIIQVALPPSATDRELLLMNPVSSYTIIDDIFERDFINYFTTQGDFIIATHPKFLNDPGDYIQAYADYRTSTGYTPIVVDLEQIYDQFAYGVSKHVQGVRNLTGFSIQNWATPPKYMFMIGKSRPYFSCRKNPFGQPSYTPTFGHNMSDNLVTATPQSDTPRIPFGRIPVVNSDQIRIYMEKVVAYEGAQQNLPQTIEDRGRLKRIMHLGGGDPLIQNVIKNNFDDYKNIAEGSQMGADVTSFFIESNDPIAGSNTRALDSLINDGTSLITFYGHSSPSSLDFNINNPQNYENEDRYFTMLSMGCYSGQIHQKQQNLSEKFVFEEDKAAVAFIATVGLSGLGALDMFATRFYENMVGPKYGLGLGDIIQGIIADLDGQSSIVNTIVYQQMTLNGDPSIRINTAEEPDYIVNGSEVTFGSEDITNRDDIEICVPISNLGRSADGTFHLLIERILPDGNEVVVISDTIIAPDFETTYCYTIPAIENAVGLNEFRITVDADNEMVELPNPIAEDNNVVVVQATVLANAVQPILPKEFRIMPDAANIVLEAEIDPFFAGSNINYQIEIDTTELFDSPLKLATAITQSGGTLQWQPAMPYADSTVYYWRVRADENLALTEGWETSSFIYINEEYPGWNQSHAYQFQKDEYENMTYNVSDGFEFITNLTEIAVNNAHYPILPSFQIDYSVDGSRIYDVENCELSEKGLYVVLFDENMDPLKNYQINSTTKEGLYNSWICKSQLPVFLYPTHDVSRQTNLRNFLTMDLPNIDAPYVLIYSLNDYMPETWDSSLFDAFASYGITDLQNTAVAGGVPYVALLDINNGTAEEVVGQSTTDIIEGVFLVEGSWHTGTVSSPPICLGAATEWGSVHWGLSDQEDADEVQVNIYGIQADGTEVLLIEGITDSIYYFSPGEIDPVLYPFIRLEYEATDELNQTPPQLDYWRVLDYVDTDGDTVQDPVDACPDEFGDPDTEGCPCLKLNLKVFLEGPLDLNTADMSTVLSSERKILPGQTPVNPVATATPAGHPYSGAPWNYAGLEGSDFTNSDYSGNEVDWILVSLRTSINKADEIGQVAGLLMKDGTIEVPANCEIQTAHPGPFYIVIEHRNHMGVMSASPVAPVNGEVVYDFRLQDSYKDITSVGQKQLSNGAWVMLAGDMNQSMDNVSYDINGTDKIIWATDNGVFDTYSTGDLNLDGDVNGFDKIPWVENNGSSSRVPK